MAPVIGHAAIAVSAVIIGTTAVIIRIRAVIDRAAIAVVGPALGRGDRKAGPDNTGKSGGCGGATAPIEPAAGAEVGGVAGRALFARWGGPGESERRPYRRQRHRRNVAITAARPWTENTAFCVSISMSSVATCPGRRPS